MLNGSVVLWSVFKAEIKEIRYVSVESHLFAGRDRMPERMPDKMPDKMSEIECQIECQKNAR